MTGQLFWLAGRVGIPLGFEWFPQVDCETLNAALLGDSAAGMAKQAFAIWLTSSDAGLSSAEAANTGSDGSQSVHVIADSSLIRATRSSVRSISFSNKSGH